LGEAAKHETFKYIPVRNLVCHLAGSTRRCR